jgi:hypothetical protein
MVEIGGTLFVRVTPGLLLGEDTACQLAGYQLGLIDDDRCLELVLRIGLRKTAESSA